MYADAHHDAGIAARPHLIAVVPARQKLGPAVGREQRPKVVTAAERVADPRARDDLLILAASIVEEELSEAGEIPRAQVHAGAEVRESGRIDDDRAILFTSDLLPEPVLEQLPHRLLRRAFEHLGKYVGQ